MYVGGNSAFACVSVSATANQIPYFYKLCQKAWFAFAHSSKEWHDNLKELKTFYRFTGSVCFSS